MFRQGSNSDPNLNPDPNPDICMVENLGLFFRDEDPDPVGSGDFWPAGSGSGTFFNGSGIFFQLSQIRIRGKKCRNLIPALIPPVRAWKEKCLPSRYRF